MKYLTRTHALICTPLWAICTVICYLYVAGAVFGDIDNGVLAVCLVYGGIRGSKNGGTTGTITGALVGGMLGNALSDCLGALLDPSMGIEYAIGITIGCFVAMLLIPLAICIIERFAPKPLS